MAFSTKQWTLLCGILFCLSITSLWHYQRDALKSYSPVVVQDDTEIIARHLAAIPETRNNVIVASAFGFHFEVYLALAWTMRRVMSDNAKLTLYARLPFAFGFQEIVDDRKLYRGDIKNPSNLMVDIRQNIDIDMIILGTCEIDMREWSRDLLSAWEARDAQHKFKIVCIVHDASDILWQPTITEWSRRDSIRLLPISQHVAETFRTKFQEHAASSDPVMYSAGYEDIPIDVHVHIIDVQDVPEYTPNRTLSNIVLQGFLDINRRDYAGIFQDLVDSLHIDPSSWGYLPLESGPSFIRDTSQDIPPVVVHLVGAGDLTVPRELENVVLLHKGLNFTDFYRLLGSMDVCITAFNQHNKYFHLQATSTATTCIEAGVPILLTQRMRDTYTFLDDQRVTITRPFAMREVAALRALRVGDASSFLASDPARTGYPMGANPRIKHRVDAMMRDGWQRDRAGFDAVRRSIWRKNDIVVLRLLRDL